MTEVSNQQVGPKPAIVNRPWLSLLVIVGGLTATAGLLLRSFARWLAWPLDFPPPGSSGVPRQWQYREALYAELGLVTLVFGLVAVLIAIVRATAPDANRTARDASTGTNRVSEG
ncbi:unnamed protein product [Gemmata massiliana]|uniref:Transmembrane protein n=1 Tax=Gemmata massiliana TaxID=1210884 RepID=A0A6P2D264_9BACT|nr:unnamed protein product [Gemmata massiliana]